MDFLSIGEFYVTSTEYKMMYVVFWYVAPCSFYVNRSFGGPYSFHLQGKKAGSEEPAAATCSRWFLNRGVFYPEDECDTFLRNVGSL
jgi:hypothetical protein